MISRLKSAPFQYTRARSLDEACDSLARHGDEAKLLAGGQSLVPMMAMRLLRPAWLVDIGEIEALRFVRIEGGDARIGAGTRQVAIERDQALAATLPLLRQALAFVGHVQTRNRGTLGGSLAHADPTAELPLVACVLGARLHLRSAAARRVVDAEAFFIGAMSTVLRAEECLEEVRFPVWPERRTGCAFVEHSIRHGDFAIVAAAAQVAMDEDGVCTRAAFGLGGMGVAPVSFPNIARQLVGSRLEQDRIGEASAAAAQTCQPTSDLHASVDYRRHLARVLAARALRSARERASV